MTCLDNPQAFPMGHHRDGNSADHEGMTLRDWFAGQALTGVLKQVTDECERRQSWPPDWRNGVASDCYSIADAMLEARKERHDEAN